MISYYLTDTSGEPLNNTSRHEECTQTNEKDTYLSQTIHVFTSEMIYAMNLLADRGVVNGFK
jgi:hypothetical protein